MNTSTRALPIGLPPIRNETLGSYLNRLADANHLTITALSHLLGTARRYRRDEDQPTNWTPSNLATLAALTGRPIHSLLYALPALQGLRTSTAPIPPTNELTQTQLCPACRLCMARHGIHGLVIRRIPNHECVCLRHRRWLHGGEQHDLNALPEIPRANLRHRQLARRHEQIAAGLGHLQAQHLIRGWFNAANQPELQHRWTQRLGLLGDDPYGDPHRPTPDRVELITYPETVVLAELLTSAYWRDHADLLTEAEHRLNARIQATQKTATFNETHPDGVSTQMSHP